MATTAKDPIPRERIGSFVVRKGSSPSGAGAFRLPPPPRRRTPRPPRHPTTVPTLPQNRAAAASSILHSPFSILYYASGAITTVTKEVPCKQQVTTWASADSIKEIGGVAISGINATTLKGWTVTYTATTNVVTFRAGSEVLSWAARSYPLSTISFQETS